MKQSFLLKFLLPILLVCSIVACSNEEKQAKQTTLTVKSKTLSNNLYYSGTIQPLTTRVVPSPAEGVILEMPFEYGARVKKGDLLFTISSAKFLTDYKAALLAFVKAKSEFDNNKNLLTEAKFLHDNELISNDDYKMKQSSYYAARLGLLQAQDALQIFIAQLDDKHINIAKLDIAQVDKITKALNLNKNAENLAIYAPADGMILSPTKTEEENKKINKGDAIKQSDVLAIIGNLNGISIRIKVNELTVNQLHLGQKVKITGIAFPEETLYGEITKIDHQGESAGNGLPNFSVEIAVKQLTKQQAQKIHVGMSAKVEILVEENAQMLVPMAAVWEKDGVSYVNRLDPNTKKTLQVAVQTGKTTSDAVAILSGLQSGDKIVIPN